MSLVDGLAAETAAQLATLSEWAEEFDVTIAGYTGVFTISGFFDKTYLQTDPSTGAPVQSQSPRAVIDKTTAEGILPESFPEDGSEDWVIERMRTGVRFNIAKVTLKNEYILLVDLVRESA